MDSVPEISSRMAFDLPHLKEGACLQFSLLFFRNPARECLHRKEQTAVSCGYYWLGRHHSGYKHPACGPAQWGELWVSADSRVEEWIDLYFTIPGLSVLDSKGSVDSGKLHLSGQVYGRVSLASRCKAIFFLTWEEEMGQVGSHIHGLSLPSPPPPPRFSFLLCPTSFKSFCFVACYVIYLFVS